MLSIHSASKHNETLDYASTHHDIVEQCKQGSRNAQFELYRLYSKAMYNICLRMLNNELDAEDVLQHSFVDVFSKLESYRHESSIGAWIKRIVINNCINHLKRSRLRFEELDDKYHNVQDEAPYEAPGLSVDLVKKAMAELPDGYRIVFSLYLLEGYDHEEIAEILSISEATSKSQFHRAKKRLKEIIESKHYRS